MTVRVHFTVDPPDGLDAELVAASARAALAHAGRTDLDVDVVLVDEAMLTRLHVQLFDDPTPTDVIAVDLVGDDAADVDAHVDGEDAHAPDGEVFVSLTRAREVAERRGHSLARETSLYVVHGVLHLCGHDDIDDAPRLAMRRAEREVLRALGFADDERPHEED